MLPLVGALNAESKLWNQVLILNRSVFDKSETRIKNVIKDFVLRTYKILILNHDDID